MKGGKQGGLQAGLLDWHELDPAQQAVTSAETVGQISFFSMFRQHPGL